MAQKEIAPKLRGWARTFVKGVLGAVALLGSKIRPLVDIDKDGDVDYDDLVMLYNAGVDAAAACKEDLARWAAATQGQRIDMIVERVSSQFPKVDPRIWVGLNWLLALVAKFAAIELARRGVDPAKLALKSLKM